MENPNKLCSTPRCNRKPQRGRLVCATCRTRKYALNYPLKRAYNNLKSNARRRGKPFTITYQEFCDFAIKTEYLNKRGRNQTGYTIDRIDPTKGYTADNIQVLTNSQNIRKRFIDAHYNPEQRKMEFATYTITENPNPEFCPF